MGSKVIISYARRESLGTIFTKQYSNILYFCRIPRSIHAKVIKRMVAEKGNVPPTAYRVPSTAYRVPSTPAEKGNVPPTAYRVPDSKRGGGVGGVFSKPRTATAKGVGLVHMHCCTVQFRVDSEYVFWTQAG